MRSSDPPRRSRQRVAETEHSDYSWMPIGAVAGTPLRLSLQASSTDTTASAADQANVGVLLDPCELREVHRQRPLGGRLGGEVEVLQRLVRGKAG
jgi:hypothetical protein